MFGNKSGAACHAPQCSEGMPQRPLLMVPADAGTFDPDRLKGPRQMQRKDHKFRELSVTAAAVLAMAGLFMMMLATALSVMAP
jgi:hypothetical protein